MSSQKEEANVYENGVLPNRPIFGVKYQIQKEVDREIATLDFYSSGDVLVSSEKVVLSGGKIVHAQSSQPHLKELCEAKLIGDKYLFSLDFNNEKSDRSEACSLPLVTSASLALFVFQNWDGLVAGENFYARFPIFKIKKTVKVRFKMEKSDSHYSVILSATNPILNFIFGKNEFYFSSDGSRFFGFSGWISPRDQKKNGRWKEYWGNFKFDRGLLLS